LTMPRLQEEEERAGNDSDGVGFLHSFDGDEASRGEQQAKRTWQQTTTQKINFNLDRRSRHHPFLIYRHSANFL
jgi:hypothetical protein